MNIFTLLAYSVAVTLVQATIISCLDCFCGCVTGLSNSAFAPGIHFSHSSEKPPLKMWIWSFYFPALNFPWPSIALRIKSKSLPCSAKLYIMYSLLSFLTVSPILSSLFSVLQLGPVWGLLHCFFFLHRIFYFWIFSWMIPYHFGLSSHQKSLLQLPRLIRLPDISHLFFIISLFIVF